VGLRGRQNGIAASFHRVFQISLSILISSTAPHLLVTLPSTLCTVSILTLSSYDQLKEYIFISSRDTLDIDGFWIGNWIYCTLKQLATTLRDHYHTQTMVLRYCLHCSSGCLSTADVHLFPSSRPRRLAAISHQSSILLTSLDPLDCPWSPLFRLSTDRTEKRIQPLFCCFVHACCYAHLTYPGPLPSNGHVYTVVP
jgi:hypothetical protein